MTPRLPLFTAYGIEIEYMIVDRDTLYVLPITDQVLKAITGKVENEVVRGKISWSNELALHVIELKTTYPVSHLSGQEMIFQEEVRTLNALLSSLNGKLMPTGMHPWMNPYSEFRVWPYENNPIYEAYNRIFNCRGHGWANLQSAHLNLPFSDEKEFVKLHAAIRILLPILPVLSASSPLQEGQFTPFLDTRLEVYRQNAKSLPSITGKVVPETVRSIGEYETNILERMYRDISPLDPEKVLQEEWLNSRGAIARFERYTIEIRILDTQECPLADLAIMHATVAVLRALVSEKWSSLEEQHNYDLDSLYRLFLACQTEGERALISEEYLKIFGFSSSGPIEAKELWYWLIQETLDFHFPGGISIRKALEVIQKQGPLARRIREGCRGKSSHAVLKEVYEQLCNCLQEGKQYEPVSQV